MIQLVCENELSKIKYMSFVYVVYDANYEKPDYELAEGEDESNTIISEKVMEVGFSMENKDMNKFMQFLYSSALYIDKISIDLLNKLNALYGDCYIGYCTDIVIEMHDGAIYNDSSALSRVLGDIIYGK